MNVCFILVLSIILQLLFGFLTDLLFPGLSQVAWMYFMKAAVLSVLTVFLPAYLYLKDEKKGYFNDCFKDIKPGILCLLSLGIGVCGQYTGILVNFPVRILITLLGGDVGYNLPPINTSGSFVTAVIVMCILPAVFEEVLFRGVVFNYFRQFGKKAAVIISSLLFAIMHFDYSNFFATFLLGLICAYMICWTNRIIYPMIAHFAVNFISVLSTYIQNFDIANNFYIDCLPVFFLVSVPLIIYLLMLFKSKAVYMPYHDQGKYETVVENVIPIGEGSSIKIIEHDIKENNMGMAFKKLYGSVYFYILLLLFIYLGGTDIWH